jgi:hypothetical protein
MSISQTTVFEIVLHTTASTPDAALRLAARFERESGLVAHQRATALGRHGLEVTATVELGQCGEGDALVQALTWLGILASQWIVSGPQVFAGGRVLYEFIAADKTFGLPGLRFAQANLRCLRPADLPA